MQRLLQISNNAEEVKALLLKVSIYLLLSYLFLIDFRRCVIT